MGIFSAIGDAITGKKYKGYQPKHLGEYDDKTYERLNQRLGPDSSQITGPGGIQKATAGFDFNPQKQAIAGFSKGAPTYDPYSFNFKGLPEQYGTQAYNAGARDIRHEGQGQLEQIKEGMGTRRPGLFMKAAQDSQRRVGEQLGGMRENIGLEEMRQNVDLNRMQQESQAGENARAFGMNEDNRFRNLGALEGAGRGMVSDQSGLVENERNYQDKALQYLMQQYMDSAGLKNQAAQLALQKKAQSGSLLGSLAGAAGKIGSAYFGGAV